MKFDAKFHAFLEVNKLLDKLLPEGTQLTIEQADAVHACAKKLAEDLTSGEFMVADSIPCDGCGRPSGSFGERKKNSIYRCLNCGLD